MIHIQHACLARAGNARCNETAPISGSLADQLTQSCNLQPCPAFSVVPGPWGSCNATCGGGVQARAVACTQGGVLPVADTLCGSAMDGAARRVRATAPALCGATLC